MANPKGNPQNLIPGANPKGRPKKAILPSRNEFLEWLTTTPGQLTNGNLLDDAKKRFHEILTSSNSSASIEWLFNQLIGQPRSTIKHEIGNEEVVRACAVVFAKYIDPDKVVDAVKDLLAELGENEG